MQELDEFQAYVLVRRWSQEAGEQVAPDVLSQKQRAGVQAFYYSERGYINSCLDFLLQSDLGRPLVPHMSDRVHERYEAGAAADS